MMANQKIQDLINKYRQRSNYDAFAEDGRRLFLQYDQEKIIRRFHLKADNDSIYFSYLSFPARIVRNTGEVQIMTGFPGLLADTREVAETPAPADAPDPAEPLFSSYRKASVDVAMTVYEMFTYSLHKQPPVLSGQWASVSVLGGIIGAYHSKSLGPGDPIRQLAGKSKTLKKACAAIHGIPVSGAEDVSYQIPVFEDFPVWFQFWDGDEEFPPSSQFLLDQNALQFIRYETVWYMTASLRAYLLDYVHTARSSV
ncbi:MAG: DUF3786 domain-containing protein [Bilifractor sp.]